MEASNLSSLTIACRVTGILGTINLPPVEGKRAVLEYTHPLAHIDSVISVIDEGMKYMRRLDNTVVAGMLISSLRYLGALRTKQSAAFLNAELCKAPKGTLIHCTKAIVAYVIPASREDQGIGKVKISFDAPLVDKNDAKLFIQGITASLLEYHLDCEELEAYAKGLANADTKANFVSPYAYADKKQLNAMLDARATARAELAADQYAKVEAMRVKKKEQAAKHTDKGTYRKDDLYYSEALDACAVELHINNAALSRDKIRTKLMLTFERLHKLVIKRLPTKTNSILRQVGKTLDTMPEDRLAKLHDSLTKSDNALHMEDLARIIQLVIELNATDSVDVLDDLEIAPAIRSSAVEETKPALSLKERLAKMRGIA